MRSRLMLAFVVLIVSSASATILIGDAVFGGKIFQLAKSKAGVDLRTAWQIWEEQLVSRRRVLDISSLLGFDPQALPENNALLTGDPTVPRSFDVATRSLKTNRNLDG